MRVMLAAALAALLSACATQPAPEAAMQPRMTAQAEPAKAAPEAAADDSQRLVCVDEVQTGSHLRRTQRVCATAEEWARRRELHQKAIGDLGQRARQSSPRGN